MHISLSYLVVQNILFPVLQHLLKIPISTEFSKDKQRVKKLTER